MYIFDWGFILIIFVLMDGVFFGMVVLFSDGIVINSIGVLYFYLIKDDLVVKNMKLNVMFSLVLLEV